MTRYRVELNVQAADMELVSSFLQATLAKLPAHRVDLVSMKVGPEPSPFDGLKMPALDWTDEDEEEDP